MDKYYQLLDKDPSTISIFWKVFHIICLVVIIVSGFVAAYTLGKAEEFFGHNCVLFASISFLNSTTSIRPAELIGLNYAFTNSTVPPFNMSETQWGSFHTCYFCQFTPLCSTIFGFVWCALFIICSRGGAGYMTDEIYKPWRLIYPAMVYHLISTFVMLASLLELSAGIRAFCEQFEPIFHTKSCSPDIDVYTQLFSNTTRPCVRTLKTALSFTYVCFFAGLIHLCFIVLRVLCVVDFQVIRITVTKYKPKKDAHEPSLSEEVANTSTRTSFALPEAEKDTSASDADVPVPIAQSESLSDVLSLTPRDTNKKGVVVYLTTTADANIDEKPDSVLNVKVPEPQEK